MCNSTTPAGQLGLTDANHECHCGSANPAHTISARPEGSIESDYLVDGMTCSHCVASVTEELSELDGVERTSSGLYFREAAVRLQRPAAEVNRALWERYRMIGGFDLAVDFQFQRRLLGTS